MIDKFIKDSTTYLVASVISTGIAFITLPIYTRFLSPADYGIIALFLMFGKVSASLVSIGISSASYRYYFELKDDSLKYRILNSTNFLFLLVVFFLSSILVFYLSGWVSSIIFDGKITKKLILFSFYNGSVEYLINYITLILTAQLRSITYSFIIISHTVIKVIIAFYYLFIQQLTYMAIIYATIISNIIIIIILIFLFRKAFVIRFSLSSLKKSLLFAYPLTPTKIIGLIYTSFDKLMLNNYTGLTSIGYYIFGQKFGNILKIVMDSIGKVWLPFFMNNANIGTNESRKSIVSRFYELSFFYMTFGLFLIYYSEEMIKILTTKEYYPAMYVVPIYVFFYFFSIIGTITVAQFMYAEKLVYRLPIVIVSVFVNILLNLLLIPHYGAIGAAFATSLAQLVVSIISLYYGQRVYPLPISIFKLIGLYIILFIFTIPVYPIMDSDINFLIKILIKMSIIFIFILFGIKLKLIAIQYFIDLLYKFIKIFKYT